MPVKHSFSILCCNLKLVAKIALFVLILVLIATACFIGILYPIYQQIRAFIEQESYVLDANSFLNHPINSAGDLVSHYLRYLQQVGMAKNIVLLCLVFIGFKFFITLPLLPTTKVLYNKMVTGFDIGITNAFISTGFQNLLLSFVSSIVLSLFDFAVLGVSLVFWMLLYRSSALILRALSGTVAILIFILLYSARMTLICQWLPEICQAETKNIFQNLGTSLLFSAKRFRKNYLCILFLNLLLFAIVTGTALLSVGVIPLVAIPFYYVMYSALGLTLNFSYHKTKYYLDNGETIYTPSRLF